MTEDIKADAENIMKRCQIGTKNYNEANNLHAECYGTIGRLLLQVETLAKKLYEMQEAKTQVNDKPYGYVRKDGGGMFVYGEHQVQNNLERELVPIYLHPQREWQRLTDEEQNFIYQQMKSSVAGEPFWVRFADAIEAKLKEKNT